jgi:hypothetical protein
MTTPTQAIDATIATIADLCACQPDFTVERRFDEKTAARYWSARVPVMVGAMTKPKVVTIAGPDLDALEAAAIRVVARMSGDDGE